MKSLLKHMGLAVLGVVVMLAWWSIRGGGDTNTESLGRIPVKVWEGGAGTVEISVETSGSARFHISFEKYNDAGSTGQMLSATETIAAGSHSWTIDVPAMTSSSVDLTAENPQVGATMKLTVRVNGTMVYDESHVLDEALPANYAFGLGCEFADIAQGTFED